MAETGPTDDLLRRLLAAVAAEASDPRIERILADARAEAEQEIADLVKSAYKALLLRRATEQLEALGGTTTAAHSGADPVAPEPIVARPRAANASPAQAARAERPLPEAADADVAADADSVACYIYAITPATPEALPADLTGIDPRWPLEIVRHDDVQAIVSPVSEDEFSQAALDERVTDPQWVEEKVRAHDQII